MSRERIAEQEEPGASRSTLARVPPAPLPSAPGRPPGAGDAPVLRVRRASPVPMVVAADLLALLVAAAVAFDLRVPPGSPRELAVLAYPLLGIALLAARRTYRWSPHDAALDQVSPIIGGLGVATLLSLGIDAIGDDVTPVRSWLGAWVLASLLVVGARALLGLYHRARLLRDTGHRPTLIVGAGAVGARLARRLAGAPDYGLRPVGFLDDAPLPPEAVGGRPAPVLGGIGDLDRVVDEHRVEQVIIAFTAQPDRAVVRVVRHCEARGVEVALVPRLFDLWNHRTAYDPIGGLPVLRLKGTDLQGWQFVVKHTLDRVVSAAALVVLAPLMLAIAVAVRLSSPGPALFRQRRIGIDGTSFDLLKFRSMRQPSAPGPSAGAPSTALAPGGVEGVDRRTSLGRFLRRTSLDELPQLVNVVRGDMSLVGPRPERPEFVDRFVPLMDRYDERHRVKSGLTGWAQIHGLRGKTSLADRIEMDNFYIEHFSLGLDLRILLRTVVVVFRAAE